ncbi:hypothetical protein [Methylocapsa sp. S129]|uniref:hypothetical protein n=1 Tax=Methylocapsa sp. S129 TaxID=1641869 RepID=UPI00131DA101|nr:hypothetical protein [Methylocapsa sp. S129]
MRDLAGEIDATQAGTVLISSEHFSKHFDRPEALRLATDFSRYEPRIVITLRSLHGRFLSAYNTHVTAGGWLTIEEYARSVLIPVTRYMSMRETLLIWQEAFGAERIHVIDYDAQIDVTPAILRHCGFDESLAGTGRHRNRVSLLPGNIEALRRANVAIKRTVARGDSLAGWAALSLLSILCRQPLAMLSSMSRRRTWALSAPAIKALDEIAASDRQFVAETYGLALVGDAQARERILVSETPPA